MQGWWHRRRGGDAQQQGQFGQLRQFTPAGQTGAPHFRPGHGYLAGLNHLNDLRCGERTVLLATDAKMVLLFDRGPWDQTSEKNPYGIWGFGENDEVDAPKNAPKICCLFG